MENYDLDKLISIIEDLKAEIKRLEEELDYIKNKEEDDCFEEYDSDRAILAYNINLESK